MTHIEKLAIQFPKLAQRVQLEWGTKQCRQIMLDSLGDGKETAVFNHTSASALISLIECHDHEFPKFDDSKDDINPEHSFFTMHPKKPAVVEPKGFGFIDFVVVATVLALVFGVVKTALAI